MTKFTGILTELDVPSTHPLTGAHGHRVTLPAKVAGDAAHTLIGRTVSFVDGGARRDAGVIQDAFLLGKELIIRGELVDEITSRLEGQWPEHALAFEAENLTITDEHAEVWEIEDLTFTGAGILPRQASGFRGTVVCPA